MKTLITTLILSTAALTSHAMLLFDDFNGAEIDTSKWSIITRADGSSVTESGGSAVLHNRGTLISLQSFAAYDITSRFRFTGTGSDRFLVWTRTQGVSTNPYSDLDDGVFFGFQQDSSKVLINVWNTVSQVHLTEANVSLPNNTWFDFRVTDDGSNVALYFNDLTTPLLTAATNFVSGNKIAFNNALFDVTVKIDQVQVVPEPSTAALTLIGLLGLSFRRRNSTQNKTTL